MIKFVLIAFVCIFALVSCGKDETAPKENAPAGQTPETSEAGSAPESAPEAEIEYMGYEFPDTNYEGYEFRILSFEIQSWAYTAMTAEEQIGEVVNDAIYMRNVVVEDRLNIKISEKRVPWGAMTGPINNTVKSGSDDYDITLVNALEAGPLAQKGLFLNLNGIAALALDRPWWDQNANSSMEIGKRLYFTTTDATAFTFDMMGTMYFNKTLCNNLGLESPYKKVRENTWTMDEMYKMMRAAAKDTDGDGAFTYEDTWGFAAHAVDDQYFFGGQKMIMVKKDENGYPFLPVPDEHFVSAYAKMRQIFNLSDGDCISAYYNEGKIAGRKDSDTPENFFMDGKALFLCQALSVARMMRETTTDFGIIPFPKYDEKQDNYYSVMNGNFPTFEILTTQGNPERAGAITNALTAVSSTTLKPAYYEITLNNKMLRDEESIEMIDIQMQNRVYDLAMIYGWGQIHDQFRKAAFSPGGENPMTVFEKYAEKTNSAIEKMINSFSEIE